MQLKNRTTKLRYVRIKLRSKDNKKDLRKGHKLSDSSCYLCFGSGGGGIRTHGALADTLVFKTRALNHSTTPPGEKY